MKSILIIGAGAMGAAFSVPCIDNKHKVTLSEPYDLKLIKKINSNRKFHPYLKIKLNKKLIVKNFSGALLDKKWDLIVVAVSSIGIDLVRDCLKNLNRYSFFKEVGTAICTYLDFKSFKKWNSIK